MLFFVFCVRVSPVLRVCAAPLAPPYRSLSAAHQQQFTAVCVHLRTDFCAHLFLLITTLIHPAVTTHALVFDITLTNQKKPNLKVVPFFFSQAVLHYDLICKPRASP